MQNALTISGNNLTLDDIYQVSHKHRPVEIEEKSMELLVNTRKLVFELSGSCLLYTSACGAHIVVFCNL